MTFTLTSPEAIAAPDGYLIIGEKTEKEKPYRRRDKQLIIRLTESELSEFSEKMKEAKMKSRADFIMSLVRDKPIIVPEGFREIAVELKREGNNFNQCLRHMQKYNLGSPDWKMDDTINQMSKLYGRISEMLDELKAG